MAELGPHACMHINHPVEAVLGRVQTLLLMVLLSPQRQESTTRKQAGNLISAKGCTELYQDPSITAKKSMCLKRRKRHDT